MRWWLTLLPLVACAGRAPTESSRPAGGDPQVATVLAVLGEFQHAIAAHDHDAMLRIMLDADVPFRSRDVATGALYRSTAGEFATFIADTAQTPEERFADVVITERDGLAVLDANYQFLVDGKATNHGREVWTLIQVADGWKITMVTWTVIAGP